MVVLSIAKKQIFWLALILVIAFWVRTYKIDSPIADWHSWRQADTAAVARNFYKEGYNPFIPKYDDMTAVSGERIANPQRYRFVEFPIYNSLIYFSYLLNGGVDERLGRLISVFMSLGSVVFIFLIVKRYWDTLSALVSALIFAILPFNIYFSRVILPEPTLVFFSLGMFYFTDLWIFKNSRKLYFISVFFTACALLLKPYAVFYLLPLIYSYYQKEKRLWPVPSRYFFWIIPSLFPFFLWRVWMSRFPEGIPASDWLFNGDGIRFKPAFWRWIIGDRFGREILTVAGSVLFFLGLLFKPLSSEGKLLHILMASSFLYLIVFATGNVRHDYYQTLIVPALSIFTARGFVLLFKGTNFFIPRILTIPISLLLIFLMIYLGWLEVKNLYRINNPTILEAGKVADRILPKDAKVVAPYNGDTAFLYQINRPGFPVMASSFQDMTDNLGITHLVSVSFDSDTRIAMEEYTIVEAKPNYIIIDLTKKKNIK